MTAEQFPNARAARQHLMLRGYVPIVPGSMEGAICWIKADEDGYYLVAKSSRGARLMHYSGKPNGLPDGATVTSDNDDKRAGVAAKCTTLCHACRGGGICLATTGGATFADALTFEFSERLDCCVHALSLALDITYADSHAALEHAGRRYRCATHASTLRLALKDIGARVLEERRLQGQQSRITELVRPRGRYIVLTADHYFAVVNGVVLDTYPKPRRALRLMWLVQP